MRVNTMHLYKSKLDGRNVELEMSDNHNHWTLAVDPGSRVTVTYKTKQGERTLTWPQEVADDLAQNQVREALDMAVLWFEGEDARYYIKDLPLQKRLIKLTQTLTTLLVALLTTAMIYAYQGNLEFVAMLLSMSALAASSWLWARYKYRNSSEYPYFRSIEEKTNPDLIRTNLIQGILKSAQKKMKENNTKIEE